jgi:hypothetical protein
MKSAIPAGTTFDLSSLAFNISMNLGKLLQSGQSS